MTRDTLNKISIFRVRLKNIYLLSFILKSVTERKNIFTSLKMLEELAFVILECRWLQDAMVNVATRNLLRFVESSAKGPEAELAGMAEGISGVESAL